MATIFLFYQLYSSPFLFDGMRTHDIINKQRLLLCCHTPSLLWDKIFFKTIFVPFLYHFKGGNTYMFLHTLLRILKSKVDSHGFKDDEIFLKLFEGFQDPKSGEDIYSEESSLKNILSGARAVKDSLSKQLATPDGFDLLQGNIEYNYIPLIENRKNLYINLIDSIQKSKYVLNTHKRQIANQYTNDYFSDVSLASLIALCILISNYNSSIKCKLGKCESEIFFKNYELNISFVFGSTSLLRERIWHCSQQSYFISHKKGNRFAALNIIERLLPKGYIEIGRAHV